MWHPAHLDGCTLVVIRRRKSWLGGYDIVASGRMHYDGSVLQLVGEYGAREVTDAERETLQPITAQNGIPACRGFDFFSLQAADAG